MLNALTALARIAFLLPWMALALADPVAGTLVPGQLRVGMDISYPPLEYFEGETPKGFDVELANALAARMGLQVAIQDARLPNLVLGLMANHFDTVISGLYILPGRLTRADAIPYADTGAVILVRDKTPYRPAVAQDLCGHRVGLQMGTTWIPALQKVSDGDCRRHGAGTITLSQYPTSVEVSQALLAGHLDAQVEMDVNAKMLVDKSQGRLRISSTTTLYPQTLGIFVKKGNQQLLHDLQHALTALKVSGAYQHLLRKYNLQPAAADPR